VLSLLILYNGSLFVSEILNILKSQHRSHECILVVAGARRPDGDQIPTTDGKKEVKVSKF
jgi:hypothetical protein